MASRPFDQEHLGVVARIAPVNASGASRAVVTEDDGKTVNLCYYPDSSTEKSSKAFVLDHAYGPNSTQDHVYSSFCSPLVSHFLGGNNATVVAYGQANSGKGSSLFGNIEGGGQGLVHQVASAVFGHLSGTFRVRVSYMEVHHRHLHDLLKKTEEPQFIWLEKTHDGHEAKGMSKHTVGSPEDIAAAVQHGRAVSSHARRMPAHTLFTIHLEQISAGHKRVVLSSKFTFVHLASSDDSKENLSKDNSLQRLGICLQSLTTPGTVTITDSTFESSILTQLVMDVLVPPSKTVRRLSTCNSPLPDANAHE